MALIQLANVFTTSEPRINLLVKIKEKVSPLEYVIADTSGTATMVIKVNRPTHKKYLNIDQCIKIVNPGLDMVNSKVIIEKKTHVFQGTSLLVDVISHHINLSDIKDLGSKELVTGKLTVKVVKCDVVSITTMYGLRTLKKLTVKDLNGGKTNISVWRSHKKFNSIVNEGVYSFTGLFTDNFPTNPPHFLSTKPYTVVENADPGTTAAFEGITEIDETVEGIIIGFQDVYLYKGCPNCKCSISQDGSCICRKCGKKVAIPDDNFKFAMVVQLEEDKGTSTFVGFKSILNTEEIVNVDLSDATMTELGLNDLYENHHVKMDVVSNFGEGAAKTIKNIDIQ